jgi:hypothetical protein
MKLITTFLGVIILCSQISYSFAPCKMCLEFTQKIQSSLISLTPESLVKSAVQLVCERKCILFS